jgi:glycosyltransferase 2 family protein
MNRNIYLKAIKIALLALVLFFLIKYLYNYLFALEDFNFSIDIFLFLLSIVQVWFWLMISSYIFHLIMKKIISSTSFRESLSVWSSSYLGTYIPGKIGVIAYRIMHYSKKGISSLKVSYGFVIEMILSIISSLFVVLIGSLFTDLPFVKNYLPWILGLFIILVVSVHPKLIQLYAQIYFKFIRKTNDYHITPFNYFFYLRIIGLQLIKWCFSGLGIFLLINSVTELPWSYLPFVTGLYAVAAIIGIIAFFAPSGLGVVEGVMIIGLKAILSNSLAGLVSILIRLWKVTGELSFILLVRLILRSPSKRIISDRYGETE